jgi:phospholipase C
MNADVEHVIVLMLENRSFDHLLGFVQLNGGNAPGMDDEGNPLANPEGPEPGATVYESEAGRRYATPLDPGHSHAAVMQQLGAIKGHPADNLGFITSYLDKGRGASPELRDRLSIQLKRAAGITVVAAVVQGFVPIVVAVWLGLLFLVVLIGVLLIWNGTVSSGHLPMTLLRAIYKKSEVTFWAVLVGVPLVTAALIAGCWFDRVWVRIVTAVVLVAAATWLYRLAIGIGRHDTVVNSGDVLQRAVMSSFTPAAIEPLATLAQSFGTCTRWFSPVPGETWPNRNFVHAGTSDGAVDIEYRLYKDRTIFQALDDAYDGPAADPWRVYFKGVPQVLVFPALWGQVAPVGATPGRFRTTESLYEDIKNNTLPAYSFVEPFYGTTFPGSVFAALGTTDSQHAGNNRIPVDQYDAQASAGHDFVAGMRLTAEIYQHLKNSKQVFDKTVFVVTYDEHGGFFDHKLPPTGQAAPEVSVKRKKVYDWLLTNVYCARAKAFDFAMLGARVPTIIISPRVRAEAVNDHTFDHTSIPRTVRKLFGITAPLSERENAAEPFDFLFGNPIRNDLPDLQGWLDRNAAPLPGAPTPVDDALRRSLDWVSLAMANYADEVFRAPAKSGNEELKRMGKALAKAQRRARRESLKALGRDEAGTRDQRDDVDKKVAMVVEHLAQSANATPID